MKKINIIFIILSGSFTVPALEPWYSCVDIVHVLYNSLVAALRDATRRKEQSGGSNEAWSPFPSANMQSIPCP